VIARCPQCQTRYRIPREKLGTQGARIRCSGCQTIFRVQAPAEEATPPVAPLAATPQPPLARALVAEADAGVAKGIREFLESRRIASEWVESGSQALLCIFRNRPDLVVLGAHLPDVGAPVIAELLRRSAELRDLPAIRITAPDERGGAPEVEASATLEAADLPAGLGSILERLRIGQTASAPRAAAAPVAPPRPATPVAPVVAPAPAARPAPPPPPASPAPARPAAASGDPEIAKAERLARITISDIILYNERKFAAAAATGKVAEALASELAEARQHFDSRVSAAVRGSRDFLVEELQRRAAQHRP
jgi:predicted Zn finger-like uncharacterized protein